MSGHVVHGVRLLAAWLHLTPLATTLNVWLRHISRDGDLAKAEPKTLHYRLFGAPARQVVDARRATLKVPPGRSTQRNTAQPMGARKGSLCPRE